MVTDTADRYEQVFLAFMGNEVLSDENRAIIHSENIIPGEQLPGDGFYCLPQLWQAYIKKEWLIRSVILPEIYNTGNLVGRVIRPMDNLQQLITCHHHDKENRPQRIRLFSMSNQSTLSGENLAALSTSTLADFVDQSVFAGDLGVDGILNHVSIVGHESLSVKTSGGYIPYHGTNAEDAIKKIFFQTSQYARQMGKWYMHPDTGRWIGTIKDQFGNLMGQFPNHSQDDLPDRMMGKPIIYNPQMHNVEFPLVFASMRHAYKFVIEGFYLRHLVEQGVYQMAVIFKGYLQDPSAIKVLRMV